MRARNSSLRLAATLPALALALASSAEPAGESGADARWVPAFSVFGGVLIEGADATVSSVERGDFDDSATAVFAAIGGSGEVSTPALSVLPGRPRLFAHADVSFSLDSTFFIVSEGSPGPITPPEGAPPNPAAAAFKGQGSRTGAEALPPVLSAGAGLAFGLQIRERQLRIKPSLEWMWHETEVMGEAGVVEPLIPPPPGGEGSPPCPCRTAFAQATETRGWSSLGAGLEIELDTARAGPFVMALYASGQFYHVLGDRTLELNGSAPWSDGSGNFDFESTYEADPWRYRLGFGLRFRWLPD